MRKSNSLQLAKPKYLEILFLIHFGFSGQMFAGSRKRELIVHASHAV